MKDYALLELQGKVEAKREWERSQDWSDKPPTSQRLKRLGINKNSPPKQYTKEKKRSHLSSVKGKE